MRKRTKKTKVKIFIAPCFTAYEKKKNRERKMARELLRLNQCQGLRLYKLARQLARSVLTSL